MARIPGESANNVADKKRLKAQALLDQADNWEKGALGEVETALTLSTLPPDFRVIHDLQVPGHKENIDYLVIGPTGVFLVDSKKYTGTLTYGKGTLWSGKWPVTKKFRSIKWEAKHVSESLDHEVVPIMCFVSGTLPAPELVVDEVLVVSLAHLNAQLLAGQTSVSSDQIVTLCQAAQSLVVDGSPSFGAFSTKASLVSARLKHQVESQNRNVGQTSANSIVPSRAQGRSADPFKTNAPKKRALTGPQKSSKRPRKPNNRNKQNSIFGSVALTVVLLLAGPRLIPMFTKWMGSSITPVPSTVQPSTVPANSPNQTTVTGPDETPMATTPTL
jgi:Nuclease-related domain